MRICPMEGETDCLSHRNRMFVLIWATLLFAVRSSNVNADNLTIAETPPVAEGDGLNLTSGVSNVTAEHLNNSLTENMTYPNLNNLKITGNPTVKEGDTLSLTCSIDSLTPSEITWTKLGLSKNLKYELHNGTATLVISNVTAEHAGQYICTAKHLNNSQTENMNVTVTLYPKILNSSVCKNQSEVLTCVCIRQGVPLPIIEWPLLENHTEYKVITTVSNHTVNSTIILTVKDHSGTAVECVSKNKLEKMNELNNQTAEHNGEDTMGKLFKSMTRLEMIIAFLIGGLLSAIICCLASKCHRRKKRTYGNLAETLEMVTHHQDTLIDAGQAVDQGQDLEASGGGGAVAAGNPDVEYSDLDFSLITRKSAAEAGAGTGGTTETEYAEIKKEDVEARQDREGKGEEEVIGEDEEGKPCVADETEGENVALYSSIKKVVGFEDSVA